MAMTFLFILLRVQNSGLNGLNEGQKVTYELEEQRNGKWLLLALPSLSRLSRTY